MSDLWKQLILSGGVWIVIGIVLTAIFARAKTGAETDSIVEKTRTAVLQSLHDELDEARKDRREMRTDFNAELAISEDRRKKIVELQRQMDRQSRLISAHTEWDRVVLRALFAHDIKGIPDPPTLEHD